MALPSSSLLARFLRLILRWRFPSIPVFSRSRRAVIEKNQEGGESYYNLGYNIGRSYLRYLRGKGMLDQLD